MNLHIFEYIMYIHSLVISLVVTLYGKVLLITKDKAPIDKRYRKLVVDSLPKFDKIEKLDYTKIIQNHFTKIKPVSRRKPGTSTNSSVICPRCNAPHKYLYDNNGGNGQYKFKLCKYTFKSGYKSLQEVFKYFQTLAKLIFYTSFKLSILYLYFLLDSIMDECPH